MDLEPSAREVAERAGVSVSTVSRALRGLPRVSAETRQRVEAAAAELGYRTNPAASTLAGGAANTVAMIVPDFTLAYYGQVIGAAEAEFRRAGRRLLLYRVPADGSDEPLLSDANLHRSVDGLLLVNVDPVEALTTRLAQRPVVTLGAAGRDLPGVSADDFGGARQAARHLIGLGHRRIAALVGSTGPGARHGDLRDRRAGWLAATQEAGLELVEIPGPMTIQGGEEAMTELLGHTGGVTGVVAASDEVALGAMKVARSVGFSIPGDLSIVGYDDSGLADAVGLTTVNQSVPDHGRLAARILLDLLAGGAGGERIVVPSKLVIRATTARPADG